jgi:hypothetical protein
MTSKETSKELGHGHRRFRAAGRSGRGFKALLARYPLVFYFIKGPTLTGGKIGSFSLPLPA